MERYLVIWCADLLEQNEQGREARAFDLVLKAVSSLATHIETVRQGVCAVPTRGPSRYFGGDTALCKEVAGAVESAVPGTSIGVGVADGLFASLLAARTSAASASSDPSPNNPSPNNPALVIGKGGTPAFLAVWPVTVLERPELADLLVRLGIRTLGQFSSLPTRSVLARFGKDGAACHLVASGKEGELSGLRAVPRRGETPSDSDQDHRPVVRQPGFWGGTAEADIRASAVLARLQEDLGAEEVLTGRLQGGRGPSDRARLVPVDTRDIATRTMRTPFGDGHRPQQDRDEPWPGRLPPPSPQVVLGEPAPVTVMDASGAEVVVSARVLLSSAPARVSVAGGPWQEVAQWAGPWPADDRWWSPSHRRRARVQVITASGSAQLLVAESGRWWLEGVYD